MVRLLILGAQLTLSTLLVALVTQPLVSVMVIVAESVPHAAALSVRVMVNDGAPAPVALTPSDQDSRQEAGAAQ